MRAKQIATQQDKGRLFSNISRLNYSALRTIHDQITGNLPDSVCAVSYRPCTNTEQALICYVFMFRSSSELEKL